MLYLIINVINDKVYEIMTLILISREAQRELGIKNQQGEKKESIDFGHVN